MSRLRFRTFLPVALFCTLCCALAMPLVSADHKNKVNEVQVVEMKFERADGLISVDGTVKNVSDHSLKALAVLFRFEDTADSAVTTKRFTVDEPELAIGAEAHIEAQLKDAPRAVQVHILAMTGAGADLHVRNDGPFPID